MPEACLRHASMFQDINTHQCNQYKFNIQITPCCHKTLKNFDTGEHGKSHIGPLQTRCLGNHYQITIKSKLNSNEITKQNQSNRKQNKQCLFNITKPKENKIKSKRFNQSNQDRTKQKHSELNTHTINQSTNRPKPQTTTQKKQLESN